jgi:hypothetical protein
MAVVPIGGFGEHPNPWAKIKQQVSPFLWLDNILCSAGSALGSHSHERTEADMRSQTCSRKIANSEASAILFGSPDQVAEFHAESNRK